VALAAAAALAALVDRYGSLCDAARRGAERRPKRASEGQEHEYDAAHAALNLL